MPEHFTMMLADTMYGVRRERALVCYLLLPLYIPVTPSSKQILRGQGTHCRFKGAETSTHL